MEVAPLSNTNKHLVVLGCSSLKSHAPGVLPAVERYDGPMYKVLRSFLRASEWPEELSIAVLSAKYGLIGGLASIEDYDHRMNRDRASELSSEATQTLLRWGERHNTISLVLGKDYLPALDIDRLVSRGVASEVVEGPIGVKLQRFHNLLKTMRQIPRSQGAELGLSRTQYFLPDWDDMLDKDFDFETDSFSSASKATREEEHCIAAMQPYRICDGVLVSLAQHLSTKGSLKKFSPTSSNALSPQSIRHRFGLQQDQALFGDCGAFSYVNDTMPTITVDEAVSLYHLYNFDFGASVDHIPVSQVSSNGTIKQLTESERANRVKLTRENAQRFLDIHRHLKCSFTPVGTIQSLSPDSYGRQLIDYAEMGYSHVAIGGLVPQSDADILAVAHCLARARAQIRKPIWIHLFGVYRPRIRAELSTLGMNSFDSATYFRKAWLRSDQNYLGTNGSWYAAIRVPMTSDGRTRVRLLDSGVGIENLQEFEHAALRALHEYGAHKQSLDSTLAAVVRYDALLSRGDDVGLKLIASYRRTLAERPWEKCTCSVCRTLGIDVLIFRGANRNKRRGAHNTLMLYRQVTDYRVADYYKSAFV